MIINAQNRPGNVHEVYVNDMLIKNAWYLDTEKEIVKAYIIPLCIEEDVLLSTTYVGTIRIVKRDPALDYFGNPL